ncbi:uncharacterized protein [Ptychodera flava]|uniref:uncharacterized protein n=1 Tax=Ptychodera flava TaxID=63121 RepID=UPI00396A0A11
MAGSSSMDIDSALHELGMLSTVTESRKDYLREKESHSEGCTKTTKQGFAVIQMNPMFVTKLQPVKALSQNPILSTKIYVPPELEPDAEKSRRASYPLPACSDFHVNHNRVAKVHRSKVRFRKPYVVPKRRTSVRRHSESEEVDRPNVDNGNKGEEDVKETKTEKRHPLRLKRSKSLDDLNLSQLHIDQNGIIHRLDMEKIAQNFRDLQVS